MEFINADTKAIGRGEADIVNAKYEVTAVEFSWFGVESI